MSRNLRYRIRKQVFLWASVIFLLSLTACRGTLQAGIAGTLEPHQRVLRMGTGEVPGLREELALGRVAYVQGGDVWAKELPNGKPLRLTHSGDNASPRWSPSGKWLLFQKRSELWKVKADGSGAHRLPAAADAGLAAWSPVNDQLAYVTQEGGLVVADAEGTTEITLIDPSASATGKRVDRFAWNPNGNWLACQVAVGEPGGGKQNLPKRQVLRVVRADGEQSADLVIEDNPMETAVRLAGWSGEGTHVLYWSGPASASIWADGVNLMSVHVRGKPMRTLAAPMLPYEDFVAPEPAASRLALVIGGGRESWRQKQLIVMDADGEFPRSLTGTRQVAASPAWSPDGQTIAYSATGGAQPLVEGENAVQQLQDRRIWIASADGKSRRQLAGEPACRDERPLWSADGRHLLFARICGGQASLWLVRRDGTNPRQVVEELSPALDWSGYYGHVEWGRLFDYYSGLTKIPELPVSVSTKEATSQSDMDADETGQGVVFLKDGIVRVLNDRGEQPIARLPQATSGRVLAGHYLAYVSDAQIHVLNLTDGTIRVLYELDDRAAQDCALQWSADGSTLVYARAWDSPDGARKVELGFTDGYEQRTIDTLLARPPGPTPTPPSLPPVPPGPGFANLHILGCDRRSGHLAVAPVGGKERYATVWLYDLDRRTQVKQLQLPRPENIATLAASPDLTWLAVAHTADARTLIELYPLLDVKAPSAGPSTRASRVLNELAGMHLAQLYWSPDSRYVAYLRREGMPALDVSPALGLDVLEVETGKLDSLPIRVSPAAQLHGWTADGKAIVLVALDGISQRRTASLVDLTKGQVAAFTLPDGASVLGYIGRPSRDGAE